MRFGCIGRRPLRLVAVLVLAALATTAGPSADARTPTPLPPGNPVPLVRLPVPRDDGSLTPYTFEVAYPLVTLVYDTLLWRDESGVPRPWLARSVDESEDGRRVTVHLADGVAWHDGTPLTAADVAFTFDYMRRRAHPRFSPQVTMVERVETPDPATAVLVLRDRSPGFRDQPLADVPILPAHLWRQVPSSRLAPDGLPVGSGPYRLVEHRPGERYVFEANPSYFRGPPGVRRLEVPFIGDVEAALTALERRAVDMIPLSLPASSTGRFERLGTRVERGPSYLGTVLMFNLRRPPFNEAEARRAVASVLDLGRIARVVDGAVPADRGYLHPDSAWSSTTTLPPSTAPPSASGSALLAGRPLRVLVPDNDEVRRQAGDQVVAALGRVGLEAATEVVPAAQLSTAVGEDGAEPSFDLAIWSSPPLASYDPDFLTRVFGSDPAASPLNFSGYRSQAFDDLARRVATEPNAAQRRALVDRVLALLRDDAPVVPLFFPVGAFAFRPAVFDRWVFVKGTGILDKQSFLAVATRQPPAALPSGETSSSTGFPFGVAALGVLGIAVAVAVAALSPWRRSRRR